jgi:hypothetical protein
MRSRVIHPLLPSKRLPLLSLVSLPCLILAGAAFALTPATQPAFAIGSSIGLGTASSYSVLAGQTVTNTGPSTLSGSAGVHPGTAVVGFPPGKVGGVIHAADAQALQAKADVKTAYDDAAGQAADATVGAQLGGRTLVPGVYKAPSSTKITGSLTLDAKGDPGAVFIFQIGSGLTTASSSRVVLVNDAQSCHVFWQVGTSATLGTSTRFVGTIMALTSISLKTGARIEGRALARNGSVTLDNNVLTDTKCATTPTTKPSSAAPTSTAKPTATHSATVKATHNASSTPSSTAPFSPSGNTPGGLAFTGGGVSGPIIGIAIGTMLIGLTLVLITRRRRTN